MAINRAGTDLMNILQMKGRDSNDINKRLDDVYFRYGAENIERWRNLTNKKNTFLHELVEAQMVETIQHIISKCRFPVNTERNTDKLTAFGLAIQKDYKEICKLLKDFGADEIETVDVSLWSEDEEKERSMNMVWVDLEMTSIENPKILECAVIITDKDLNELTRAEWVIHFEKKELDKLGDWHQDHFGPPSNGKGGNDLFADCIKSTNTNDDVEKELLTLLKKFCPEGKCSLAGSSIHTDKLVLQQCMPTVHKYLHYRIIDVSSIQAVMRRWAPSAENTIKRKLNKDGQGIVNHRAMQDIEYSMSYMEAFRKLMIDAAKGDSRQRDARGGSHLNNNRGGSHLNNNRGGSHLNNNRGGFIQRHNNHSPHRQNDGQARGGQKNVVRRQISDSYENLNIPQLKPGFASMELYKDDIQLIGRLKLELEFTGEALGLKDNELKIYNENPHLREIFLNNQSIQPFQEKEFTKNQRYLEIIPQESENDCGTPSISQHCTTEHWGQRKLFLTEMEFITKYTDNKPFSVVYAGAAPGWHIPFLSDLFPKVKFILFDDKNFPMKSNDRIEIHSEQLTKTMAARLYDKLDRDVLFICNIRSSPEASNRQNGLTEDMTNQLILHDALRPQKSLLYFRFSRDVKKFKYADGNLIIEPWSSRKSTECRLVIEKDPKIKEYRSQDILNSINYFQNIIRTFYYPHDMDKVENEGLDHCYDCRAEIYILEKYLTKYQSTAMQEKYSAIASLSRIISKRIVDKNRSSILKDDRTLAIIDKKQAKK